MKPQPLQGGEEEHRLPLLLRLAIEDSREESLVLAEEEEEQMEAVLPLTEEDWVEVLRSLAAKEGESSLELASDDGGGCYLRSARKDAVEWVSRAAARHAFSPLTAVLAVNYLDRCFLSLAAGGGLQLQDNKPWMGRLAAVACLSLAAKVEETRVPLLLDLQAEEEEYVFEPRTIRRMELLVLATLRWRMNPVTPLSFIHHLLPRLRSTDKNANTDPSAVAGIAMARRCEAALLSAIAGELTSKCVLFIPFRTIS
ncbi:hypothetical protein C4D60_Mb03t00860 [Musa balbisiana]|uniref:Cyclin-like domain-containing protein n=1 Tax=Musa balbisiana TaxID=52838 RepID=A0A4S8J6M2_MUSBA|nr:hypothetical protein C4D60_Mb03t00860 [Musa balbisiana]